MRGWLLPLLLLWSSAGLAQEMDFFGFNPRAVGMAGVQAASDGDFTAIYYNPALLHGATFGLGYVYEQPFFHATTLGTPAFGSSSVHGLADAEGYTFGFSVPLGGVLRNWVTLGFGGYIPSTGLYESRLIDDGSAVYYRYANAPNQFQLIAGASVRPLPWLSLGVGAQVFGDVGGSNNFIAQLGPLSPPADGQIASSALVSNTSGAAAPSVGLSLGPLWGFHLNGVWRGKAAASYTEPINVVLQPDLGNLTVAVEGTYHFTPDEVDVGLSWEGLHKRLLLALDVAYEAWSEAPPPLAIIGIGLPPALGIAYDANIDQQNLCLVASQAICGSGKVGFSDIVYPRVGAEWRPTDRLSVRGGYFFQPTFVPSQLGGVGANAIVLDSDTHVFSAGIGYALDDPLKLARRLVVEASAQLAVATPRTYEQDNQIGKLTYQTSGVVIDVPVAVRYDF
ncbi:MAG TPA: hypothetical protein VMB50_00130 [Myxococcales bacterium]|nr:hypothetical protein [Myxococcales bacterium]